MIAITKEKMFVQNTLSHSVIAFLATSINYFGISAQSLASLSRKITADNRKTC